MQQTEQKASRFTWEQRGEMAILRLQGSAVSLGIDPKAMGDFYTYMARAEADVRTKVLVLVYSKDSLTPSHYRGFVDAVQGEPESRRSVEVDLLRVEHKLHRFIRRAARFRKILIACMEGEVPAPFFGALLACDIRIASDDTTVRMSHSELGMPPNGGLGFFLPQYLGRGRAAELMLSGHPLLAPDLLRLGLVNEVVSEHNYGEDCLMVAERFLKLSHNGIAETKRILNADQDALEHYLELEFLAVKRAAHRR